MNCISRTLKEVMCEDIADTDVKNSKIEVQVTKILASTRFEVNDGQMTAVIEFDPVAEKFANKIQESLVYTFFKLEKVKDNALCFRKTSYMKYEETREDKTTVSTTDLLLKKSNEIVTGTLLVKVWKKGEEITTRSGKKFIKVTVGDENNSLDITFWNNSTKEAKRLKFGIQLDFDLNN